LFHPRRRGRVAMTWTKSRETRRLSFSSFWSGMSL